MICKIYHSDNFGCFTYLYLNVYWIFAYQYKFSFCHLME